MPEEPSLLAIYLHLARGAAGRRRTFARARMLLLAAANAVRAGLPLIAAACRKRILEDNPRHAIGRRGDAAESLRSEPLCQVVQNLERRYSRERAETLLEKLGIELGRERDLYLDEEEYAASLLGSTPERLRKELEPDRDS